MRPRPSGRRVCFASSLGSRLASLRFGFAWPASFPGRLTFGRGTFQARREERRSAALAAVRGRAGSWPRLDSAWGKRLFVQEEKRPFSHVTGLGSNCCGCR